MLEPTVVLVWTCVIVFIASSAIALLALVGVITLGGAGGVNHNYYLRLLFLALIAEIAAVGVSVFTDYLGLRKEIGVLVAEINNSSPSTVPAFQPSTQLTINEEISTQPTTIKENLYVTSDGPLEKTIEISIPDGFRYVDNDVNITTENNDYRVDPPQLRRNEAGEVIAVTLHAVADPKSLFGPRNWVGAELSVDVDVARDLPQLSPATGP